MKAIITKVFEMDDDEIKDFMKDRGYDDDYTEEEVEDELFFMSADDCIGYATEKDLSTEVEVI